MKAALLQDTHKVVIEAFDKPAVGETDILIRVAYAGVCGSDVHAYQGTHPFRKPPVVLGHEVSGYVAELGERVKGFAVGNAVTVMPYQYCGHCHCCQQGLTNVCLNKVVPGIGGWQGTFADYFVSQPEITYKLGPTTSLRVGALAEPLAVGVHSLSRGRFSAGSRVLILGGGTIGLLTALAARCAGAPEVAITDLFDFKLEMARGLGIDAYSAKGEDVQSAIRADHPDGFDLVCLASGAAITVGQALGLIRRGGCIVVTAMFTKPVLTDLLAVTLNEVALVGTQIYTGADFRQALHWLDREGPLFDKLISRVYPLDQAEKALLALIEEPGKVVKVLLEPEPD